ncbi:MAG: winged helix-turn-helix domain-containing protein [Terracidiphilus sp.]
MLLSGKELYRFDAFEVDYIQRAFRRDGQQLSLSPRAFDVLLYLVEHPARVVSKEELMRAVWPASFVEESNLAQHIYAIRKALGDRAGLIATVPGRGYQFAAQVRGVTEPGPAPEVALTAEPLEPASHSVTQRGPETAQAAAQEPARASASQIHDRVWWRSGGLALGALAAFAIVAMIAKQFNRPSTVRISAYEQITHDGQPKSIGSTDGSRIYFTEELAGSMIDEVSVAGGPVEQLAVPVKEPWAGDVSPDGSTLLVISESAGMGPANSLWSYRLVGGSLRRLENEAIDSAWSPDGSQVVYGTATGDIWTVSADGTGERKLASPGGYIRSLCWSPDGAMLRFSKDGLLWEIDENGSNLHQLLPGWSNSPTQFFGEWDRDGRYYFVSDGQIWMLDRRSRFGGILKAKPVQLTFGLTAWDRPIVSRDGKKIFTSGRSRHGELLRWDEKSNQFQRFLGGISAEFVAFTRDAKAVVYVTYPEGILWRANADGSNPLQLTSAPVYPKSLRWSPDGQQILFVDRTPQGANAIYTIDANGGTPRRVLPNDIENETDPSWSADGKKIVYSTCPTIGASSRSDLRILDLATGNAALIPGSEGLVTPRWSPDGKFIAAMTLNSMGMKLLDVQSGKWSTLETGAVAFPEWSRDSRFIYYLDWKGNAVLARIRPGAASPQTVADVKNEHFTGFYTSWMSLDPSDAPLVLRDMGSDDIYALTLEGK